IPADVTGLIKDISADGKTITLEVGPKSKGEEATTSVVKIDNKTELLYFGVGPTEAKVRKGYHATGWLVKDSKDTLARMHLGGTKSGKGPPPDLQGEVATVARDGKSFTLHILPTKKGDEGTDVDIKLGARTEMIFTGVTAGETKLVPEMGIGVWLARGSK